MIWSDVVIGTGTGLLASFLVWFAFTRTVRPKLKLSTHISRTPSLVKKTPLYRMKIENLSLFRVYDIQIKGRIKIYGLIEEHPDKPTGFVVLVGSGNHPYIESKAENRKLSITGRELLIRPTKKARKDLSALWSVTKTAITVEYILSRDTRNALDISVIGTHAFSGARNLFTMQYKLNSIRPYYFAPKGLDVCNTERQDDMLEDDEAAQ